MTKPSLRLLVLRTSGLEQLRRFYECLGVALGPERHGEGPLHYSGQVGNAVLELYPLPEGAGQADATTRVGFAVADLNGVLDTLQAFGANVITPPQQTPWGYRAVVRDPDGRAVELYQD